MDSNELWKECTMMIGNGINLFTVNHSGVKGKVQFHAEVASDSILINKKDNATANISMTRPISKRKFLTVGKMYEGWRAGTVKRGSDITPISLNSSYIFAIVHALKTKDNIS